MSAKLQWVTGLLAMLMFAAAFVIGTATDKPEAQSSARAQDQSHDVNFY